jgi:hypothetical protein
MTAPVGTLVASGSIARADGSPSRGRQGASAFEHLSIGQNLKLQVLRQLEQHRYEVAFGGRKHVVESRVPLSAGTQIEAQVEGKGDKLELRYLNAGPRFELPSDATDASAALDGSAADANVPPWLNALAEQYRVSLDAQAKTTIAQQALKAANPELMTRGGLFLQKLSQKVSPENLESLYRALSSVAGPPAAGSLTANFSPIDLEELPDTDDFATSLADALDSQVAEQGDAGVTAVDGDATSSDGREDDSRRALRLLNLQDEGSVAWRYGTLPLLVGGQLIELDLVMFREREQHASRGSLKRLVMSLDTTHFGRVHVEARAVDSRLIVKLSAASADAVEVLSSYGKDVRAAIEQLGWAVDDVRYEIEAPHASAAQAVVKHVLSAGSVDREV